MRVLQKGGFSPATTLPHILGTPRLQIWVNYRTTRQARAPRRRVRVRDAYVRHQAERWQSLLALDHRAHVDVAAGDGDIALALAACGAK